MPTDKPRYMITVSSETLSGIEQYQEAHDLNSRNAAICALIEKGLDALEGVRPDIRKKISPEARKIAEQYDELNSRDKRIVKSLFNTLSAEAPGNNKLHIVPQAASAGERLELSLTDEQFRSLKSQLDSFTVITDKKI